MYCLVRELTGSRWGGMAAGIVYAAAPVVSKNSNGAEKLES